MENSQTKLLEVYKKLKSVISPQEEKVEDEFYKIWEEEKRNTNTFIEKALDHLANKGHIYRGHTQRSIAESLVKTMQGRDLYELNGKMT